MPRLLFASTLAALLSVAGAARAEFATPPGEAAVLVRPPARVAADRATVDQPMWISPKLEAGAVFFPSGVAGGYGRIGTELLTTGTPSLTGPVYGFFYAVEGWGTPLRSGGGLPLVFEGGVKTTHFAALVGAGVNIFTVDKAGERYGAGLFSPRASLRLGLHVEPFYLAATAEIQRRWQWKLDDVTLFQAGLAVGVMLDGSKVEPPPRRATAWASTSR